MRFIKNNRKLFLGILIGLLLSSVTVYAVNEILFSSSQISFDNTTATLVYYRNFVSSSPSDDGVAYYASANEN